MTRAEIRVSLMDDRSALRIEMSVDGFAPVYIDLDASSADKFISDVGERRARLTEQVVPTLEPKARLLTVQMTGFHTDRSYGDLRLAIRHPCFGWLSFHLDPEAETALAACLSPKT